VQSAVFSDFRNRARDAEERTAVRPVAPMHAPSPNAHFLRPIRVHDPDDFSIGSAFLHACLTIVRDRPTDRPRYSVCNNRTHLRCGLIIETLRPTRSLLPFACVVDDAKCILVTRVCVSVCPSPYSATLISCSAPEPIESVFSVFVYNRACDTLM